MATSRLPIGPSVLQMNSAGVVTACARSAGAACGVAGTSDVVDAAAVVGAAARTNTVVSPEAAESRLSTGSFSEHVRSRGCRALQWGHCRVPPTTT